LIVLALVLWAGLAAAGPRALVLDPDVTLRAAIADSLRPWLIEVVAEPAPPGDREAAVERGTAANARYVIWREGGELVVLDREGDQVERRGAAAGPLDPIAAAAAALSVKTMLRLPPLAVAAPVAPAPQPSGPADGIELRVAASSSARYEYGLDGNVALRFGASIAVRPWRDRDWRFAVIGDGGASATVDQAGFHGDWWNWAALIGASWDHGIGDWELGPWLAVGVEHSSLRGTEAGMSRSEEALEPAVRGGLAARYRSGDLWVGGQLAVEGLVTTTTYTKAAAPAQVFEIPPIGAVLSLIVGADFAP
jgi:hypothetical protein